MESEQACFDSNYTYVSESWIECTDEKFTNMQPVVPLVSVC